MRNKILFYMLLALVLGTTGCGAYKDQNYTSAIRDNEEVVLEQVDELASNLGIDSRNEVVTDSDSGDSPLASITDSTTAGDTNKEDRTQARLDSIREYLGTDAGLRLCGYDLETTSGDCDDCGEIIASAPITIQETPGTLAVVKISRGADAESRIEEINANNKILAELTNKELEYCVLDYVIVLDDEISETSSNIGLNIKGWDTKSGEITDSINVNGKTYSGGGVYFNTQKEDTIKLAGSGEYVFTLPKKSTKIALVFSEKTIIKLQ